MLNGCSAILRVAFLITLAFGVALALGEVTTLKTSCLAQSGSKKCGACDRWVPDDSSVGKRCPYCGVLWETEKNEEKEALLRAAKTQQALDRAKNQPDSQNEVYAVLVFGLLIIGSSVFTIRFLWRSAVLQTTGQGEGGSEVISLNLRTDEAEQSVRQVQKKG